MNVAAETARLGSVNSVPSEGIQPTWLGAFRGFWLLTWKSQMTVRRLPLLVATLLVIPTLVYLTVDDGRTKPYLHWVIHFYLLLLLPLYCLSVFGGMIRDELQADTFGFLATRPLSRARLFLTKYLCHLIWLQILATLHGVLLIATGIIHHIPDLGSLAAIVLGVQVLEVVAYGALSSLLGLLHQRYMVLGIIYGFVVEMGIGRIPTNINNLSLSRHLQTILANQPTIQELYDWTASGTFSSILIMGAAALLFLGVGAVIFTVKEYHAAEEMHK